MGILTKSLLDLDITSDKSDMHYERERERERGIVAPDLVKNLRLGFLFLLGL
jgi:hypothetical protein